MPAWLEPPGLSHLESVRGSEKGNRLRNWLHTNGYPLFPTQTNGLRTRSQVNGGPVYGDLNMHTVLRCHSAASSRLVGVKIGRLTQKAAQQWRPRPRWSRRCRPFARAGATGSAGIRALRSSAAAAESRIGSFSSWGWAWCSAWLLWARGDDGPALPCHGAAVSACKGRQGQQHMALACVRVPSCERLFVHGLCRASEVRCAH